MPEVSVIIPVRNRPQLVQDAFKSVISQDYSDLEVLVVDDCSGVEMGQVKQVVEEGGGRYHRLESHSGVSEARNIGVSLSDSRWVAFLDSDDFWYPTKLERQIEFHRLKPDLKISQTREKWIRNGEFVNSAKKHQPPTENENVLEVFERLLELCLVSPSSVMLERELFESLGGFKPEMRVCEDYDLWLRASCVEKIGLLDEVLIEKHGGHADQLSRSEVAMDRFRVYAIFKLLEQGVDPARTEICLKHLLLKSQVLLQGAKKRDRSRLVDLYSSFVQFGKGDLGLSEIAPRAKELIL